MLFGGTAVAQVPFSSEKGTVRAWAARRPANGECPVCGLRAPAFYKANANAQSSVPVRCQNCSNMFVEDTI